MMVQAAVQKQQQLWVPGSTLPSKERQAAGQLDTSPMSLPADQRSPSAGTKAAHLEPAGSQLWTLLVPLFQVSGAGLGAAACCTAGSIGGHNF